MMSLALISVWDNTFLIPFAARLSAAGWKLAASGGTAWVLKSAGIEVTQTSSITGEPEMLGGRVKTLHPAIHAGLLATDHPEDLSVPKKRGWSPIDLAVGNLYPFEQVTAKRGVTLEEAIENIDIGGVAILRAVVVKHTSPCGIAVAPGSHEALNLAIRSDPISSFGSVITINRTFDFKCAEVLGDLFVECIAAPGFTPDSLDKLAPRKNLRLLEMPLLGIDPPYEIRSILGGFLEQSIDLGDHQNAPAWKVVTKRAPGDQELNALHFAWKACQYVKSNAIVLASDAFFPFPDGVEEAGRLGVRAVVQPGGSQRDAEVIAAADEVDIAMVFTGYRHFRH